jgi:hypothetical protein
MTTRERLPDRRPHEVIAVRHGRFDDGRLGEIFLTAAKTGTLIDSWAHGAAIVVSIALQHGAAPETIRHALGREHDGGPATAIGAVLDILAGESKP